MLSGKESIRSIQDRVRFGRPMSIALCCFLTSQLLTGTNLDRVDACVTVGSIPDKMLIQSLGQVFRPCIQDTQLFPMIRIYS